MSDRVDDAKSWINQTTWRRVPRDHWLLMHGAPGQGVGSVGHRPIRNLVPLGLSFLAFFDPDGIALERTSPISDPA